MPWQAKRIPFGTRKGPYMLQKRPRDELGFTLIELLVTIAIGAIVTAFALPSMRYTILTNRVASTSMSLQADLAYARSEAVRSGKDIIVCPANVLSGSTPSSCGGTTDWSQGWIVFADADRNDTKDATEIVLRQRVPEKNIKITGTTSDVSSSPFLVKSTPNGEFPRYGTITVCGNGLASFDVIIQMSGNIRSAASSSTSCP